jgi:hypothetical protein
MLTAPQHTEAHVGNYQPSQEPKHVQRNAEDAQNFESNQRGPE